MGLIETVQAHLSTKQSIMRYPSIISDNVGLVRLIRNEVELKNWQKAAEKHPAWLEFLPEEVDILHIYICIYNLSRK